MELDKKSKDELRDKILEQLKGVPEGQKIHIDKELLEGLMFGEVTISEEKGIVMKIPVWSGDFLRKIDLSEISFENVAWSLGFDWDVTYDSLCNVARDFGIEIDIDSIMDKIVNAGYCDQNYSYTNAKIDLMSSFETKYYHYIDPNYKYTIFLCDVNFEGIDLSNVMLPNEDNFMIDITRSNLSNTNLKIPSKLGITAYQSNLRGIDLSSKTVDVINEFNTPIFDESDLTDTGLNFVLSVDEFKKLYDLKSASKHLKDGMNKYWIGCYLNGKRILSSEEKQNLASEKKEEYEQYRKELFDYVLGSIDEQVSHTK